jgi:tRNA G18 (ribose-2'-O)-methylase SpoU
MRKLKLEELNRPTVEEYKNQEKLPVVVVLDDIRSAMNVGSVFRSSDAFAIEKICLCGISAKPPHREITKTAIGATESVDWQYYANIVDCLEDLKDQDYTLLGIEQTDSSGFLTEIKFERNTQNAIVLGNEVNGVSNDCLSLVDIFIEIPQYGTKHSLNVSVCAGIVLWELNRQMREEL